MVVTDHTALTVQVVSSRERVDVSGSYVLTIEGDAGCRAALRAGLASRRYGAVVSQAGAEVRVLLSGADFRAASSQSQQLHWTNGRSKREHRLQLGRVLEHVLRLRLLSTRCDREPGRLELCLYFAGGAVTSVSPTRLSGFFNGVIRQIKFHSYRYATCCSVAPRTGPPSPFHDERHATRDHRARRRGVCRSGARAACRFAIASPCRHRHARHDPCSRSATLTVRLRGRDDASAAAPGARRRGVRPGHVGCATDAACAHQPLHRIVPAAS